MDLIYWIGGIAAAAYLYQYYQKTQKEGDGKSGLKVPDGRVSADKISEILEDFNPRGTNEADVQKQLNGFLRKRVEHVRREYTVEQGTRIDFDLGNGEVGLEVKMGKQLRRANGRQRMLGQVHTYLKNKYEEKEVIILVVNSPELNDDNAWKADIQEDLEGAGATVVFLESKR